MREFAVVRDSDRDGQYAVNKLGNAATRGHQNGGGFVLTQSSFHHKIVYGPYLK